MIIETVLFIMLCCLVGVASLLFKGSRDRDGVILCAFIFIVASSFFIFSNINNISNKHPEMRKDFSIIHSFLEKK